VLAFSCGLTKISDSFWIIAVVVVFSCHVYSDYLSGKLESWEWNEVSEMPLNLQSL